MKLLDVEQGGLEWNVARFGRPTCSRYAHIITPKDLKYSKSSIGYAAELLAEWSLGMPLSTVDMTKAWSTGWTERGTDMEDEARRWYSFERDVDVQRVGFMMRNDERTGGSPDGLVGPEGGVDFKCLTAANHMKALLNGVPDDWTCQVQGYMYISERSWWDVVLYSPVLPKIIHRVERDDKFILALHRALGRFLGELDAGKRLLLALPGFQPPPGAVLPDPVSGADGHGEVEPDPAIFTDQETEAYLETLNTAVELGALTKEARKAALQLHVNGSWAEARAIWSQVMHSVMPALTE